MRHIALCALLILAVGVSATETDKHRYVILWNNDEGCRSGIMYPEGGCPHYFTVHAQLAESLPEVVKFINNNTVEQGISLSNGRWGILGIAPIYITHDDLIGVYQLHSRVDLKWVETGDTYQDTETETKIVSRPYHKWEVAKP